MRIFLVLHLCLIFLSYAGVAPAKSKMRSATPRLVKSASKSKKPKTSLEQLSKANVLVQSQNGRYGSGFFMMSSLLVTNHHVIDKAWSSDQFKYVVIINQEGERGFGVVVATDQENDLAIIKTLKRSKKTIKLGNYKKVKIGDDIFVFGSPEGLAGTLSKGIVSAKRTLPRGRDVLQIDALALKGSSGSPVLSKDLKVIGVLKGGPADTLNFAIPVTYLYRLIKQNKSKLEKVNKMSSSEAHAYFDADQFLYPEKHKSSEEAKRLSTALLEASGKGVLNTVKNLISAGADVNHQKYGETALWRASREGHVEVVKALLSAGAKVDIQNPHMEGWTALMGASSKGHVEVVKALLSAGANVNHQNKHRWNYGRTALMGASSKGHVKVAKILIFAGANVNLQDKYGWTALWRASSGGHVEVVKALLSAGADVNIQDEDGETALWRASSGGHVEVVKALLSAGADVNHQDNYGKTTLWRASSRRRGAVVKVLLSAGAKVNLQDRVGWTLLMDVISSEHVEVAKILISAGAKLNLQDSRGRTALMIASSRNTWNWSRL